MSELQSVNLPLGAFIQDRYVVLDRLGIGSTSIVYKCHDNDLSGRIVALKVLLPHLSMDSRLIKHFEKEIVYSYVVNHKNVLRTFEYIREGNFVALALEYISGGTLAELIKDGSSIDIDDVLNISQQICSGVEAIHNAGVVHRDLKPDNILLKEDRTVRVADFSIAWTQEALQTRERGQNSISKSHTGPEYFTSGELDQRSDIYSIGVLIYQMLTKALPFGELNAYKHPAVAANTKPVPPHIFRNDCPREISQLVLKAIRIDPDTRHQSVTKLNEALGAVRLTLAAQKRACEERRATRSTSIIDTQTIECFLSTLREMDKNKPMRKEAAAA